MSRYTSEDVTKTGVTEARLLLQSEKSLLAQKNSQEASLTTGQDSGCLQGPSEVKDKLFKCGFKPSTKADYIAASPKWIPTSFIITSLSLRFAMRYL